MFLKNYKKKFVEKSHSVFEGFKGAPTNTLKLFFLQNKLPFFFNVYKKNAFYTNSKLFHKNMQVIKKKEILYRRVFKL